MAADVLAAYEVDVAGGVGGEEVGVFFEGEVAFFVGGGGAFGDYDPV